MNKKLYTSINILILNQALSDFMISFFSNTFTTIGLFFNLL